MDRYNKDGNENNDRKFNSFDINDIDLDDLDDMEVNTIDEDSSDAYGTEVKEQKALSEWDLDDEEEIQEFISRDINIIAKSRGKNQKNKGRHGREDRRHTVNSGNRRVARNTRNIKDNKSHYKVTKRERVSEESEKTVKNLYEKWLDLYHKNTMQILYGTLAVLVVLLFVSVVATYPSETETPKESKQETTTTKKPEETTKEPEETTTPEEETSIQPEIVESDIHQLISSYIDAAYLKADMEKVKLYVDDTTNMSENKLKNRQKYIEAYENISCYKLECAIENSYIVFVTYDAKLFNIETLAPSAETFIVQYDATNSKYYIHNLTVAEEIDSYIAGASKIEHISEIKTDVQTRLENALASDAELKRVYDIMINSGSQTSESATNEIKNDNSAEENTTE